MGLRSRRAPEAPLERPGASPSPRDLEDDGPALLRVLLHERLGARPAERALQPGRRHGVPLGELRAANAKRERAANAKRERAANAKRERAANAKRERAAIAKRERAAIAKRERATIAKKAPRNTTQRNAMQSILSSLFLNWGLTYRTAGV